MKTAIQFTPNAWNRSDMGQVVFLTGKMDEQGDPIGYGFASDGTYITESEIGWVAGSWREVNVQFITGLLIIEARNRGFNPTYLSYNSNKLLAGDNQEVIFENGKWANLKSIS